jgi:hypothetical protein
LRDIARMLPEEMLQVPHGLLSSPAGVLRDLIGMLFWGPRRGECAGAYLLNRNIMFCWQVEICLGPPLFLTRGRSVTTGNRQRGFATAVNAMAVQAVDIRRIRSNLEGPVNHRFLLLGEQSIGES